MDESDDYFSRQAALESWSRGASRRLVMSEYKTREPLWFRDGMIEALVARWLGRPATGDAVAFEGTTLIDLAVSCLFASRHHYGVDLGNAAEVFRLALARIDFLQILAEAVTKVRDEFLAAVRPAYLDVSNPIVGVKTFHPSMVVPPAELPPLTDVAELRELPLAVVGDAGEELVGRSYGVRFDLSRQVTVNDDAGAWATLGEAIARTTRELENRVALPHLVGGAGGNGAVLHDGLQVIAVGHGNVGSAGAFSLTALGELRAKMARQLSPSGAALNLPGDTILAAPESVTAIEALIAPLSPATRFRVVADSSIVGTRWYLVSSAAKPLRHCHISGERPSLSVRVGFATDNLEFKLVHDFAAGAVDYRGAAKGIGA